MNPTQGQRSTVDSSIEVINNENESRSNVNSQASLNNVMHPAEGLFSDYTVSSGSPAFLSSSARNVQSLNGWSSGEPSSSLGSQDQMNEVGFKMDNGFSSDGFRTDSTSSLFPSRICIDHDEDPLRNGSLFLHGSSSNQIPQTINLNTEIGNCSNGLNVGESSSGSSSQAGEDSGGGSSYKRKASEGSSRNFYSSGTSGCLSQHVNDVWRSGSSQSEASGSLSLSTPLQDFPNIGPSLAATNVYPSMRDVESTGRPLGMRLNPGQVQEASPFSLAASFVDPVNANSRASETQPNRAHHPALGRNIHQVSWNGASSSRTRNYSSTQNHGERFAATWEDINPRSLPRNNSEHPMFAPVTEMRNLGHNQSIWGFTRGNSSSSSDVPLGSRAATSPNMHYVHTTPAWGSPVSSSMYNLQRLSELAPWSSFPSTESDTSSQVGSFSFLPSGPVNSSSEVAAIPSGHSSRSHRPRPRRSGLLLERQNDDSLHMRHLGRSIVADNDGRHRLISEIRQVLSAMRRGENLRIEDYMVFDPLIYHGMAEMYDRHRDMRLDVDNMSYEELLALGERIGDVSTGLGEEIIMKAMKQRKYACGVTESQQDVEPCCVCQEEYNEGDDVGRLECGHDFHAGCIKQWLMLKNICPICKTTGLSP